MDVGVVADRLLAVETDEQVGEAVRVHRESADDEDCCGEPRADGADGFGGAV